MPTTRTRAIGRIRAPGRQAPGGHGTASRSFDDRALSYRLVGSASVFTGLAFLACLAFFGGVLLLAGMAPIAALAPRRASAEDRETAKEQVLSDEKFALRFGPAGITSLKQPGDPFGTEFVREGGALGTLSIAYRRAAREWCELSTADARGIAPRGEALKVDGMRHRIVHRIGGELEVSETFSLEDGALVWTMDLRNVSSQPVEVGDLAFPLPFNTTYVWDRDVTYTKRQILHFLVCGHASFLFLMRPCGEGPFLLLTPLGETKIEFFDLAGQQRNRLYRMFIHSALSGPRERHRGGTWRQPHTALALHPDRPVAYGFRLRWVDGYDGVRDELCHEGLFDVNVVPGMTVPVDLYALVALRTRSAIGSVTAEHFEQTRIEDLGARGADTRMFKVTFSRLGENLLTVSYGQGRRMTLEFFVTEPLETLLRKRAAFLVDRQQHRDPSRWYDGLISDWDMKGKVLRGPDDLDGLNPYVVACDDPGLCKAPFVASVNVEFPDPWEVEAVDYYIDRYVWGGLQCTDDEKHPFAIYGIPNWKVNRGSADPGRNGREHLWRIYDYPHVVLLYFRMYQIARLYPEIKTSLRWEEYLRRAHGTAKAFFTVPLSIEKWSAYETGTYNELVIPDLIRALEDEGRGAEAADLRAEWERKVRHFVLESPYLLGSEYPFDSTGFESTHALARYAMEHASRPGEPIDTEFRRQVRRGDAARFLERQIRENIACRGWIETAYYYLGSDYRASLGGGYTLSYMSQMGGSAVVDYALRFAADPARHLRLGYASFLSSWALMNTGTPESNYGYWYPGKENDGAAGGGFEPRAYAMCWLGKWVPRGCWQYGCEIDLGFSGALRTAATIAVDDPLFGLFAYGGILERKGGVIEVIPRDGLRKRFHLIDGRRRLGLVWERDGFAAERPIVIDDDNREIRLVAENRGGGTHEAALLVSGLTGSFRVEGVEARAKAERDGMRLIMKLGTDREQPVRIEVR